MGKMSDTKEERNDLELEIEIKTSNGFYIIQGKTKRIRQKRQ